MTVFLHATALAVALLYYGVSTIVIGATPGSKAVDVLQQRVPALFEVRDRQATTA